MQGRKDLSIQSLRGLAITLVVAGHVIGDDVTRGLKVSDDSLWRLAYQALEDLRVPLFTLISGLVYALRPVTRDTPLASFVNGKAQRLLVPLVCVGLSLFALQNVVPGTNAEPRSAAEVWRIVAYSFEHLWFLQAVFLIFLVVAVLEATDRLRSRGQWLTTLGVSLILSVFLHLPADLSFFSLDGALRLFPFFLLGLGLQRFPSVSSHRTVTLAAAAFAVVYTARLGLLFAGDDLPALEQRALSTAVGATGLICLYAGRHALRSRAFAWLGGFAFTIYLLHPIASAAARVGLERMFGLQQDGLAFALGLVAGLALPVVFEMVFGRSRLVSRLILGVSAERARAVRMRRVKPAAT